MTRTSPNKLRAYRWATSPFRTVRHWTCALQRSFPIHILFYHRVAKSADDPWTIDEGRFIRQIDWLESNFDSISLVEAQRRIRANQNPRPSVCVTFDDGYADNLDSAIPLLLERGIPFTYFITWDHVCNQKPFEHDLARGTPRKPNSIQQIRSLANLGVDIGSHTLSHADLGKISDPAQLAHEMVDSKAAIEDAIGFPVRYFAFPFGQRANLNKQAFEIGRRIGYWGMCSAFGQSNSLGRDPFHLCRFHGDPELEYVKNWLTFDPRLIRSSVLAEEFV